MRSWRRWPIYPLNWETIPALGYRSPRSDSGEVRRVLLAARNPLCDCSRRACVAAEHRPTREDYHLGRGRPKTEW
jgi:hypothetical protein